MAQTYELFSKNLNHGSPIKEHPLEKADERFKNMYFDLLYITAQYENPDTENQIQFIKRIMDGTNSITVISDHIRNSCEMTPEKAAEFTRNCISLNMQYIFFVDCMLVACSTGNLNKKQVDYLCEAAAALEIEQNDVRILCEYVIAILEQNTDKYEKTNKKDTNELYKHILCYVRKFVCGAIANTKNLLHLYSMTHQELSAKKIIILSETANYNSCEIFKETIIFENIRTDLSEMTQINNFHIGFNCARSIIFRNCDFINGGSFRFHGCHNIIAEDCNFINFSNDAVFDLNPDCTLSMKKCYFKNCGHESVLSNTTGGIIRSNNLNKISFKDCTFDSCFALGNFKGGIISFNNIVEANGCKFNNCRNGMYLFYSNNGSFKGENNKTTDCVELKG